ncbi:MAG: glycosyltransferase family 2 protein [Aridibacter sp.]
MEEKLQNCTEVYQRLGDKRIGKMVLADENVKVSVIIPAFNVSASIAETLDSVLAQTYKNFEAIIVNDGSPDTEELEQILENYFPQIIYATQKNHGVSQARNTGICLSRGELIAFLDGDDVWLPNYLESQIKFLEANKLDMVYANAELIGDNFLKANTYMETTPSNGEVNTISLLNAACNVLTSGTVLRKRVLEKNNLFDTDANGIEDFELWFRLAKNGTRIGYQKKVLLKHRVGTNGLSGCNIKRGERNVRVLNFIKNKYWLALKEKKVWKHQMEFSQAELELEKGKVHLIKENYDKALDHITEANKFYQTPKLRFINWLLRFSPALTVKLFKKFRTKEVSFIEQTHSESSKSKFKI